MTQRSAEVDRKRGTLLGLAVGDALGAAVEFQMPGTFPEVTGFRGGGPHGLAPGEWTDDLSTAITLGGRIAPPHPGFCSSSRISARPQPT